MGILFHLEECVSTGNRLIINEPPQSPLFPLLLILPKGELKIACLKREREYGISLLSDITISIVKDVHRYVEEVLKNAVKCERRILLLLSYRDAKSLKIAPLPSRLFSAHIFPP